ncbi:nitrate reductase molybdenum cofactor assembly chaperone [Amycolatopsis minnesotensis]|uniref:Nitrate reductase molybdenum cofactor assembly chaperone n=1 Tax=Amycolatopsis minnesotensis TaxID=337894 RepID=A0ABP5CKL0_9PSEU
MSLRKRRAPVDRRTRAIVRQIAGWCLQYPDDAVLGKLVLLQACLDELGTTAPGHDELTRVLSHLREGEAGELAAHYTEVFDRRPRRTLHLSWFSHGDTRRRGQALADLKAQYRKQGFALAENELPDFLPVVLEFATAALDDEVLAGFHAGLNLLRDNLAAHGTPYEHAVAAVLATMPSSEQPPAAEPPVELVGLDPFPTGAGGGR